MKRLLFLLGLLPVAFASTVIGTTNITFADTIVAEVVSKIYNYPVIILPRNNLTTDVIQTLKNLNATEVIIIGGPYVVTPEVETELKNLGLNVTRIWGVTRYETSALVAEYFWDNSTYAVLVTRELTDEKLKLKEIPLVKEAVERAIDLKAPLLITPIGRLEENVAEALIDLGVKHVYIYTRAPLLHTNLTRQLEELNITYEIISQPRYKPKFCRNITLIEVPENVSWYKLKEIFLITCTKIKFVNKANITEVREMLRKKIEEEYRKLIKHQRIKFEELLMKNLGRIIEKLELDLKLIGNKTLEKEFNETIEKLKEGNLTALKELFKLQNKILEIKWKEKLYLKEMKVRMKYIIKEIKEIRRKIIKRIHNITEVIKEIMIKHKLPELKKNKTIYCIQVYEPVICCNETGCAKYSNLCEALRAGWEKKYCHRIVEAKEVRKEKR